MFKVLPFSSQIKKYAKSHNIASKLEKQIHLLKTNTKHPSLNVELLEPKKHGIYSFRIDRKYRALFIFRPDKDAIEILLLTLHYK